ncbi:MAG: transglycosylase SLT domain-containing protein [Prevotella sp.]|nr:transglycosylase SLT domain-containing protein [Prevotella sp.]
MRNKKYIHVNDKRAVQSLFMALCLLLLPAMVHAQITVVDDNTTDDEIEVVDEMGNEEEIEFPEAMTYELDSLMNQYMTKTYLTADNDCRMKDENPTFGREVYIDRLQRMPTIMEMPYNEVVQSCIDRYTGRLRRTVSYMLGASNFYMPFFEEALETYQMPLELKYLPIIESALNPTATSRAGAGGLWQFMITTGKMYGLEVNSLIDERRNPVKASYAAARYLRDLYKIFGDWNLVIAAYNCGPENINKAIRRAGGEKDYWKIYPYLPRETRGYVPAFIAANYVMNYYCEHNICPMSSQLPAKTDTVMVDRNVAFAQIAEVCGFDMQMLRALNPEYRRDIVPGATKPSPIRLPMNDVPRFIDMQDSVYAFDAGMQKRLEVAVEEPVVTKASRRGGARGSKYHTVRRGDTLGSIAKRNKTTVAKLKRLNGIRGNNIRAGQKVRVR